MKEKLIKKVEHNEYAVILLFFAIVTFFFLMLSPSHPFVRREADIDSSVFKTIALMMEKGYMPYRDSFDHKGPLLYLFNWLGSKINYTSGILVFEFITVLITFFEIYKIARMYAKRLSALLTTFLVGTLLVEYFGAGNFCEEYAMPFIAVSIHLFLEYLLHNKVTPLRIGIAGLSLGAVCLLRPNMIAVWIVFCAAIFIKTVVEKDWRRLGQFALWFILGFLIIVVPFVIWLAMNGALEQCIKDYILFNMRYTSATGKVTLSAKWKSFKWFLLTPVNLIAMVGMLIHLKKNPFTNLTYFVCMFLSLILCCLSGRIYGHYGLVLIPVFAYPISLIFYDLEKISNERVRKVSRILVFLGVFVVLIVPGWLKLAEVVPRNFFRLSVENVSPVYQDIKTIVDRYSDEDEPISVYGSNNFIYVYTKRLHATRYSYQFPISSVMPDIMTEYLSQLQVELPVIVVVTEHNQKIHDFLSENNYEFVWGEYGEEENSGKTVFYRR